MDQISSSRRVVARYSLPAIFVCALLLRVLYVGVALEKLPPDTDAYLAIASNLASGGGYNLEAGQPTAFRPPGYPLFLAFWKLLAPSPWAPLYLQAVLGASVVFMAARMGRMLVGKVFGLFAAIAVAVDPFQIAACGEFMTECLQTFLVAGAFLLLLRALRARYLLRYVLAGLAAGAAGLTRPEFLVFLPGAVSAVILWGRRGYKAAGVAALLAAGLLLPGLWGVRNSAALAGSEGRRARVFTTTHGGYTHLLAYNEVFYSEVVAGPYRTWPRASLESWQKDLDEATGGMSEAERDRYYSRRAREFTAQHPPRAARVAVFEMGRFWAPFPHSAPRNAALALGAFFLVLAGLAAAGIYVGWGRSLLVPLIVYVLAAETLVHAYYWSNIRMRVPFHPLLAVLAAAGVAALFGRSALVGEPVKAAEEETLYSPAT